MTVLEAVQQASQQIDRRDAETLLLHGIGQNRAWLFAHPEAELTPEQLSEFFDLVSKRAIHWPLQYLTGQQEFFGLELHVSQDTLIPRPETELLVEAGLEWVAAQPERGGSSDTVKIIDVGTGTGAIAIALAHSLPAARVLALDLSQAVRPVVERNAYRHGVEGRVRFLISDLLTALGKRTAGGERFDVVVSNPPYVPLADAPTLQPEVRDYEPHTALFAGEDGLEIYRRLIPQAWTALRAGGLLAMEFGFGQRDSLAALLGDWNNVVFRLDYAGIPRLVLAERP